MATTKKTASNKADTKVTQKKLDAVEQRAEKAEARAKSAEKRAEEAILRARQASRQESLVGKQVRGFVDFLREQSVVGLAIGLVLGTQAKVLVDQLVVSFLNPLTGLLLPGEGTLKQKSVEVVFHGKTAVFTWGAFVSSFLTFVLVAAIVYYVFKGLRLDKLDKKKES